MRSLTGVKLLLALAVTGAVRAVAQEAVQTEPGGTPVKKKVEIAKEDFRGWANTYRIGNGVVEARVVTDVGPRIVDFRLAGGENVLHVRDKEAGKSGESKWMFRGGWRLWVAPEKKETTYALDNSPCEVQAEREKITVTGPPQPEAGIQKIVELSMRPGESALHVKSRIKNVSDQPRTYAPWSLPVLRPGGRAFLPLDVGPLTAFDSIRRIILWSYTEIADPRYRFADRLVTIDHARVKPADAEQTGRRDDESKIGVDSARGWQAYLLGGTLFLKRFPHDPQGQYPDGGATMEVYSSAEFLELEHLGPLATIAPGAEIAFEEHWWLFAGAEIPPGEEEALSALQKYMQLSK